MFWGKLALGMLALASPFQDPGTGVVRGEIRSERTGEPVPLAMVEVVGSLVPLVARADSQGVYILEGVPAGRRLLRARAVSHTPFEVEILVVGGREFRVDFSLPLAPLVLPELVAVGGRGDIGGSWERGGDGNPPGPELGRAVVRSLEASSGIAELGLVEITRALRPGQEPVDPAGVLYVRGAPTDLKLVLVDGAPVYAPFQVGGLLPTFGPEQVARAELFLGGAPARYDGGLSYVLDLETRSGDRTGWRHSGSADLLKAEALVEGPLGAHAGLVLGGRTVHGRGADWLLKDQLPYGFGDLLGRLDLSLGSRATVGVTGYWNRESIRLDDQSAFTGREAVWGNRAGSLRYNGPLVGRQGEITLALGSYGAKLPIGGRIRSDAIADGRVQQARIGLVLKDGSDRAKVQYGFSYEHTNLEQRLWMMTHPQSSTSPMYVGWKTTENPGELETRSTGEMGGAFVDVVWEVDPRLRIRGGARAVVSNYSPRIDIAPRLALVWSPSDRAVLTVAGGKYRQLVRENVRVISDDKGAEAIVAPRDLQLAQASHLLLGLDQLLADEVALGLEGYYKRFDGVPADAGSTSANASGIDLWIRRSQGRLTGWLGYSLAWVWTSQPSGVATDHFSGRQLLSLGLSDEIGAGGRAEVRVGYGAGVPFAALPVDMPMGGEDTFQPRSVLSTAREMALEAPLVAGGSPPPDAPYLRVDAELSYLWDVEWGGTRLAFTPYLKVYNALDRRDAFFYLKESGAHGRPRPLAALPLLPVIGVQWRF